MKRSPLNQKSYFYAEKILISNFANSQTRFRAIVMEQHYSKDQLLEIYFNTTYFGAGATGIKSAALTYFDKLPQEMQLAECAIIAALPYAPSALNPLENPEGCKKRQRLVLQTMVKRGYIGTTLAEKTSAEPVFLANGATF